MSFQETTLCLTIGRRPKLLKETLLSLQQYPSFHNVIAINDFRDEETNDVFRSLCPNGTLLSLDQQLGHHKAVDTMYQHVKTPYIFHGEDDWCFDKDLMLDQAIKLLNTDAKITSVCVRKFTDLGLNEEEASQVIHEQLAGIAFTKLTQLHQQWYGYSFNPHVIKTERWQSLGGFSQFKKERHVSRYLRKKGAYVAYLAPGACHHIGIDDSVANPPKPRLKNRIKSMMGL